MTTTIAPPVDHRRAGTPQRRSPRLPRALGWAVRVVAVAVIVAALLVLAAAVVLPRLAGATPYTIQTGSMEPKMPPGTLVVVKPVDPDEIGIGTVVTYQLRSGEPTVVTHRVVAVGTTMTGEVQLTTQGDANDVPDAEPVRPEQIRGELWYAVPELGRLGALFDASQRQGAVHVIAAGLVLYGLGMIAGGVRDRRLRTS